MKNSFRFKKFAIQQTDQVFKVGTDGVLLGAWFSPIQKAPNLHIADWGAGTGLIGLMLAQRYSEATIDLVEMHPDAKILCERNAKNHPQSKNITVYESYIQQLPSHQKWDVVVSNPPYFQNDLKSTQRLSHARHLENISLVDWMQLAAQHTHENGELAMVFPAESWEELHQNMQSTPFHLVKKTEVKGHEKAPVKRVLAHWSKQPLTEAKTNTLIIEKARHHYTEQYRALTKEFYLKF